MARVFTDAGAMKLSSPTTKVFGADRWSCAFWIFRTAAPAAERGLMGAGDFASDFGWWLNLTSTGLVKAIAPYATVAKARTSSTATTLNAWMHVVVTYLLTSTATTDFLFYMNGKQEAGTTVSTGSGAAPANGVSAFFVGPSPGTDTVANTTAPPANIGQIALWDRALTPAECMALATGLHPLRYRPVEVFDMDGANWEEGYLGKTFLTPAATIPTNAQTNPPVESLPLLWETRQNTRPRSSWRSRYFVPAAGGFTALNRRTLNPFGSHVGGRTMQ